MNAPLKTVQHQKHLQHLTNMAPIIAVIFLAQCFLLAQLNMGGKAGNSYMVLGFALTSIIGLFMAYDSLHTVHLYEDHLWAGYKHLGFEKKVYFQEIKEVTLVGEDPDSFGSLIIKMKDETTRVLYLIDEPHFIKSFIDEQRGIKGNHFDQVA